MKIELKKAYLLPIKKSLKEFKGGVLDCEAKTLELIKRDGTTCVEQLEDVEYYNVLRLLQRKEAVKRLNVLRLNKDALKEFELLGNVFCSRTFSKLFAGVLFRLKENEQLAKVVSDFENEHHSLVYHAQNFILDDRCYLSMLYVSDNLNEWDRDFLDIKQPVGKTILVSAYVANLTCPQDSEFRTIGVVRRNGGISRVY